MSLTPNGKNFIFQNFGNDALCCVSAGLIFEFTDANGDTYTNNPGGTPLIVFGFAGGVIASLKVTNISGRQTVTKQQLITANGSLPDINDAQTLALHDENSTDQWCYLAQDYTLATSVTPSGSGSVTLNPPGGTYPLNTSVELTAVPSGTYSFDYWSGGLTGATNPKSIIMNGDKTVVAHFKSSDEVTCYGCLNGEPVNDTFPVGTICSETNTPGYPYSSYHDCGGDSWTKYLLYAGIGLAAVGIIIYMIRKKPPAHHPPPRGR